MAALAAAVVGLVLGQSVLPQRFTGWLVLLAALREIVGTAANQPPPPAHKGVFSRSG